MQLAKTIEMGGSQQRRDKEWEQQKAKNLERQRRRRKGQAKKAMERPLFNSDNGVPGVGVYDTSGKNLAYDPTRTLVQMDKGIDRNVGSFTEHAEKHGRAVPGPADIHFSDSLDQHIMPQNNFSHLFPKGQRSPIAPPPGVQTELGARLPSAFSTLLGTFSRSSPELQAQADDRPMYKPMNTWESPVGVKMKGPADPRTILKTDFLRPPPNFYQRGVGKKLAKGDTNERGRRREATAGGRQQ